MTMSDAISGVASRHFDEGRLTGAVPLTAEAVLGMPAEPGRTALG